MIEVFKIIHGIDEINLGKLFCIDEDRRTRRHSLCLKIRRHVNFSSLVVSCKSLSTFEMKLDEFMTARFEI